MGTDGFVATLDAAGGASVLTGRAAAARITSCRWVPGSHALEVAPAQDHFVEILLGGRQRVVLSADGRRVAERDARPGDISFLPAGHRVQCVATAEGAEVVHLMLSPGLLAETVGRADAAPFSGRRSATLTRLALLLDEELHGPAPVGALYATALSQAFALALADVMRGHRIESAPARPLSDRQIATAVDFLQTRLTDGVTLAELAAHVGVGAAELGRRFKRATGVPPHRYLLERRIARAQELLVGTDDPIAEVALACGFHDQPHLTATMRRLIGVTPGEVRRGRA